MSQPSRPPEPDVISRLKLGLSDAEATDRAGAALADSFPGVRVQCLVVYLQGELGAGKTSLARSFLRRLGVAGTVRSPTYTLLEIYSIGAARCVHADLYRLRGPAELEDLGLREFLMPGHLLLIEWPERGGTGLPPADLTVHLTYAGDGREALLTAAGATGGSWLRDFGSDTKIAPYLSNLT